MVKKEIKYAFLMVRFVNTRICQKLGPSHNTAHSNSNILQSKCEIILSI